MDLGLRRRLWALTILALGAIAPTSTASHFRYGTLSWSPTGNPGEVEFRLIASFERDAYSCNPSPCHGLDGFPITGDRFQENQGPTSLAFDGEAGISGDFTQPLFFRVIAHSLTEGWLIGEALDPITDAVGVRHTYPSVDPGNPGFVAYLSGIGSVVFGAFPSPVEFPACCRIGQLGFPGTEQLANRAGLPYPLQTVVFPFSGNSSPVTTMVPIVVVPPSSAATFQIPAIDPDGDPIRFRVASNDEAVGADPLPPSPPLMDKDPAPGLTIDSATGVVTWNNLGLAQAPIFWTAQFIIEDLDPLGQVKTTTPVDFLLLIRPQVANPPSCSISPGGTFSATVGNALSFTVTGTDADPGDTVELNTAGIPSGATMTPALPTVPGPSPQSSVFAWTPLAADVGAHAVIFSARDASGQQALCETTIHVIANNANPPTCAINPPGPHSVQAGTLVSFTVTGNDVDAGDSVTLAVSGAGLPGTATMTPGLPFAGPSGVQSTFNWTPSQADVGLPITISFTPTDSAGQQGPACQTSVEVTPNPNPPACAIDPLGPQTVAVGTLVDFRVTGTDIDPGDDVTLAVGVPGLPAGATMNPALPVTGPTGVFSDFAWTPAVADVGSRTIAFTATDSAGRQGSCQTTINVVQANALPTCDIIPLTPLIRSGGGGRYIPRMRLRAPARSVQAGVLVSFLVRGADADQGELLDLALDAISDPLPINATMTPPVPIIDSLSPVESTFNWTPSAAQAGAHTFAFVVTDVALAEARCQVTITVTAPPTCTISSHPPTVAAGTSFGFTVTGTDPDPQDVLDLALTSGTPPGTPPAGATFAPPLPILDDPTPVSSTLSWTPTAAQTGVHTFSFLVTDATLQTATCETSVTVTNPNPPTCEISSHPPTVLVGSPFGFTVTGRDPDFGDVLDLALTPPTVLPANATMNPPLPITDAPAPVMSTLSWTPTPAQVGVQNFSFDVTDFANQKVTCQTSVEVVANVPPTITCPGPVRIEGCNVAGGQQVTLTVHVEDANGDPLTVTWEVDGVVVQVDQVPAGVPPPTSADVTLVHVFGLGNHTVVVTVSDGQAVTATCTTTVTVVDTRAPVLTCSSAQPMLWPPNHNLVNVGFRSLAADACDPSVVPVIGVFADEDDEEQTGDGHHSPDAKNIGSGSLRLRSERKGNADGRVYLMLAEATDGSGNMGLECCAVTVPHSQSKKDKESVLRQAAAAVAACRLTGAPPAGFVTVGDGPIIGPKQ